MKTKTLPLLLFLVGCTSTTPSLEKSLKDYIPKVEETIKEEPPIASVESQTADFVTQNFPRKCDWQELKQVLDGDTLTLKNGDKVRFTGVDTPEKNGPYTDEEPFGPEATAKTKSLLTSSRICLIQDSIGVKFDKYDRRLAYIFSEEGNDVNAELVKAGLADVYQIFPSERKKEFNRYRAEAKRLKLGIWGEE